MDEFSQNNQNNSSDQDKHRKRSDLQREMIMLDGELKKIMNEKVVIEASMRKLKKEEGQIRLDMQQHQERMKKVDQDVMMKTAEISHLKKQLNLL